MNTVIAAPHTSHLSVGMGGFFLMLIALLFIGYLIFLVILRIDEHLGKKEIKHGRILNIQVSSNKTDIHKHGEIYAPFLLSSLRSDVFVNIVPQVGNKLVCFTLSKNAYPEMKEDDKVAYLQKTGRFFKRIRYSNCYFIR